MLQCSLSWVQCAPSHLLGTCRLDPVNLHEILFFVFSERSWRFSTLFHSCVALQAAIHRCSKFGPSWDAVLAAQGSIRIEVIEYVHTPQFIKKTIMVITALACASMDDLGWRGRGLPSTPCLSIPRPADHNYTDQRTFQTLPVAGCLTVLGETTMRAEVGGGWLILAD